MKSNRIINTDAIKLKEYSVVLGYFISLFLTTCFFFDVHKVVLGGVVVQLPIGLIFFPLTFGFSNILQDKYGRTTANSVIILGLVFDTLLVFGGTFLAYIGDRRDYWTVFKDIPAIMISTWVFMGIGSVFNIILYAYLRKTSSKNIFGILLRFFITISATEILTSSLSMPLLFYQQGLSGSLILTIFISVVYKILANVFITAGYGVFIKKFQKDN